MWRTAFTRYAGPCSGLLCELSGPPLTRLREFKPCSVARLVSSALSVTVHHVSARLELSWVRGVIEY